ncbi:hypothetical protein BD779DRAFT_903753 [Infundibulicybe gibba]|nr:hypothetical protein BD779DRAFT_903753 [Infundibulicybe gibba]
MSIPSPITMAEQATAVNLVAASCITCLLYNHITTLDQETATMWPSRFTMAKVLFFLNRYFVEAMLVFNCFSCVFYLRWLAVTLTITTCTVQGILVMRVWALYRRNLFAITLALGAYISGSITLIGLTIQDYVGEDVIITSVFADLPGCYATSVPKILAGFWITPVIIETILFGLVMYRAFAWWRNGSSAPRVLSILAKDSTLYFAIIFVLLIANLMVLYLAPPFLTGLLVTPSNTAGCILGSHMLLHLRQLVDPNSEAASTGRSAAVVIPLTSKRPWISANQPLSPI